MNFDQWIAKDGVLECEEGCTFAEDCPHEAENLESLREALRP